MIEDIRIENLSAFGELDISLSPRVNVIIGSNGTGKTHLLKAIYALALVGQPQPNDEHAKENVAADVTGKLLRLFAPDEKRIGTLRTNGSATPTRLCLRGSDDEKVEISFGSRSNAARIENDVRPMGNEARPVFIPAKEVLSLVRGMSHPDYDRATVEMIFDDTYVDLAELLVRPGFEDEASRLNEDPRLSTIVRELVGIVGGRYRWMKDGALRFEPGHYQEIASPTRSRSKAAQAYQDTTVTRFVPKGRQSLSSSMTAEGYRKIGMLHRLLCNGSLNPGVTGVLLWDEPEANLNPKLMKRLVQVLLELSRNGQQIVLATHDYVLLKWLDLLVDQGKDDHVRFHSLFRDEAGKVVVDSVEDYRALSPNALADTFNELTKEQVIRKMGSLGR